MEQLWAPWRMELIDKGDPKTGCIFCELPAQANDRENLVLGRSKNSFAILNKYPYNNGHLMVVPRTHTSDLLSLPEDAYRDLADHLRTALRLLQKAYPAHGYNLGMNLGKTAGAGIADHLHWHIVPRWEGDTNFMPVLGNTKVMIEYLQQSFDKLRPLFDAEFK